jgi:outer membrane receptor protein involved in Fe transport
MSGSAAAFWLGLRIDALRRLAVLGFSLLLLSPSLAPAQTVGKVEGTIRDRDTGIPLAGAQVLITGTRLGNIADESGYYFINNVPVGPRAVEVSLLGYQSESQQHLILAGQTTTADFALSTRVIMADSAIVTLTELDPLVPRDNTISKSRFTADEVQNLPLVSIQDLVTLAAGASEQQGGISLRGARPDDATVYVEGLNATDFANVSSSFDDLDAGGKRSALELGDFSIEQLDVVTGGADASFGDLQSGVVNVVTPRGGLLISGTMRFTTDALKVERTDDFYELEGNVAGPLLPDGKATFFLSGAIRGSRGTSDRFAFDPRFEDVVAVGRRFGLEISRERFCDGTTCIPVRADLPLLHIEDFVRKYLIDNCNGATCPAGFFEENAFLYDDGDPDFLPGAFSDRYTFAGKLAFTPTARTDVQLAYTRSRNQSHEGDPFQTLAGTLGKETVQLAVASWRQVFHEGEKRSLAIEARIGYFSDRFQEGLPFDPTDAAGGFPLLAGNRGGDDLLNFRLTGYETFLEDSVEALIAGYHGTNAWEELEALRQPLLLFGAIPDPPTLSSGGRDIFGIGVDIFPDFPQPTAGFPRGFLRASVVDNQERRWNVRMDLDAQLSRIDRLLGGADLKFFDVRRFNVSLRRRDENSIYFVEPRLFGFYVTNRIDLGDFVLDVGGRVDHFDHNTSLPEVPGLATTDLNEDGSTLRTYDSKTAFGPRLGVAHPVTEKTQVRISFAVFNQLPGFDELYRRVTSDFFVGDYGTSCCDFQSVIGNPDLDFQQTRSFELGLTHLLGEDLVLDLVAYNRDILDGTAGRFVVLPQNLERFKLVNANNGNVRGFDLTLTKRFSDYWSGDLTYSFLDSKMTDSDQTSFLRNRGFGATQADPVPPPAIPTPADFDLRHRLSATFSLRFPGNFLGETFWGDVFQKFGLFATARFRSGLPFTRTTISGENVELPNSSRLRSQFRADLRATKYFELGGSLELGAIFEIFNLLNNENVDDVHASTGSRLLDGNEIHKAEDQAGEDVVLADIDTTTVSGALTREFRSFTDIDGDGVVSHAEQRIMGILAFGTANEIPAQPKRSYRLGIELRF